MAELAAPPTAAGFWDGPPPVPPKVHKDTMDDKDFTRLLIAQLTHQDPLEPMDPKDMVLQTAAIAGVQHSLKTNEHLAALREGRDAESVAQMASLGGKHVALDRRHLEHAGAGHSAQVHYQLARDAEDVDVRILDREGQLVRTLRAAAARPAASPPGSAERPWAAGGQMLAWDGQDEAGESVAAGRYRVEVTARDREGAVVPATMSVRGRIDEVSRSGGQWRIHLGDETYPWQAIDRFLAE